MGTGHSDDPWACPWGGSCLCHSQPSCGLAHLADAKYPHGDLRVPTALWREGALFPPHSPPVPLQGRAATGCCTHEVPPAPDALRAGAAGLPWICSQLNRPGKRGKNWFPPKRAGGALPSSKPMFPMQGHAAARDVKAQLHYVTDFHPGTHGAELGGAVPTPSLLLVLRCRCS